jgi:hypothetical protein
MATIALPGGNVTGVSDFATELSPKPLALLTETVPTVHRIALLYDAADPSHDPALTGCGIGGKAAKSVDRPLGCVSNDLDHALPSKVRRHPTRSY